MDSPSSALSTDSIVIRSIVTGDFAGLEVLLGTLDADDCYRRWFTGGIDLHRAVAWAAHPEEVDAVGLVAITAEREVVGHAALVPIDALRAEVCFEVGAAWRRHGIAGRLLDALEVAAAARGVETLVAEVLPQNADMLAVMREHGRCVERLTSGILELALPVGSAS